MTPIIRQLSDGPLRYLCFPPAGAGASYYRPFTHYSGLAAVELPGRETRHRESFATDRREVIAELAAGLAALDTDPATVVYLGHSLGATLAFELALRLPPRLLVLSARNAVAAGQWQPAPDAATASDEELCQWLRTLGGTPEDVLDHDNLRTLILSVVRGDLTLGAQPSAQGDVTCPVFTLCGDRDPAATPAGMAGWGKRAQSCLGHLTLPGDHDAIRIHSNEVMKVIDTL